MSGSKQKSKKAKKGKTGEPKAPKAASEEQDVKELIGETKPKKAEKEKAVKPPKEKKEKKVKVPKEKKPVKELPEIDTGRANQVRQEINNLLQHTEREFLDLAELLYEVQTNAYWRAWNFNDFADYADKELSIGYRKARYYSNIWAAVRRCGESLDKDRLIKLGWSKVKELAAVVSADSADEWLGNAEKMTEREVTEAVKIQRNREKTDKEAKGEAPIVRTMSLRLEESTYDAINDAISEAKMLLNTTSDVDALAHICLEWTQAKGVAPVKTPLSKIISWVEKAYGVKIKHHVVEQAPEEVKEPEKKAKKLAGVPQVTEEPEPEPETAEATEQSVKDILGL